jgi:SEC-C motif domain protein
MSQKLCPCGSKKQKEDCCLPIVKGEIKASRAQDLMRARYSAYVWHDIDFVMSSHDPETREDNDPEALRQWAEESNWLGLEILHTEDGEPQQKMGTVEFKAHFQVGEESHIHHERASFTKHDGEWYFTDGKVLLQPQKREQEKIGRNDPCLCGSGKKYKKCCYLAA